MKARDKRARRRARLARGVLRAEIAGMADGPLPFAVDRPGQRRLQDFVDSDSCHDLLKQLAREANLQLLIYGEVEVDMRSGKPVVRPPPMPPLMPKGPWAGRLALNVVKKPPGA